jgi:hypothetical protein
VPDVVFAGLREVVVSAFASERETEIAHSLLWQAARFAGLSEPQLELASDIIARVRSRAGDAP